MNTVETILWGVRVGDEDWQEQIITTDENQIEAAKEWASNNGFDRFRVAKIDLGVKPDFVSTLNIFEMGGNVNENETSDFKDYVQNHSQKESFLYNNRLLDSRLITSEQYEINRDFIISNKSEENKMFKRGGVVGQEIVFDDGGEENTGVIQEVNEITGDYTVDTDDGRTVLAQHEIDVISLGEMRRKPRNTSRKKLFGLFEKGGNVDNKPDFNRMFNFLKDDLETLEVAIIDFKDYNSEDIDRFFSYWNHHLDSLKTESNNRMFNFLKDDLETLEVAIKEKNSEEIDRFFSYWTGDDGHIKSLKFESPNEKMAKGGSVDNSFDYMMLDRLRSDNDAFLYGSRNESQLWAGNVKDQIDEMKTIWNRLKVKPEWLSMEDILDYEEKMTNKFAKGGSVDEDEITKSAMFDLDQSKWSNTRDIPFFETRLKEYKELKQKFDDKKVTPSSIIGKGYKPQYVRGIANDWLNKNILVNEKAIEILKSKNNSLSESKDLKDSTYIPNRDIVSITIKKDGKNVKLTAKDILDGIYYKGVVESKSNFEVDDIVYNTRTKNVGLVRLKSNAKGKTKTDADGNVNTSELEIYNPIKFSHQKDGKSSPSTTKEIDSRGLYNPFSTETKFEKGGKTSFTSWKHKMK
jgi:hypothetical protein